MRRGIRTIAPRSRVFFGCEGEGEQGYGALLQRIANDHRSPNVYLDLQVVKGGDPLAIVEAAVQKEQEQARKHGSFAVRVIFLDRDKVGGAQIRDAKIPARVAAASFHLVWQRPCFEALLLRHLPNCQALRPPTTALSQVAIQQQWPQYRKPMSQLQLAARIGANEIRSAATVEPDLATFLTLIGFLP
jgi:hypothetical protein